MSLARGILTFQSSERYKLPGLLIGL